MRTLEGVERCLASREPTLDDQRTTMQAAVALVLREEGDDLEALFIRRAEYDGDPWSGHLAFPGGRVDPGDAGPREAAIRETREELGLDLTRARFLGRLSDVRGHAEEIRVSAYVYAIRERPELQPNYEIREAFWRSLGVLDDPAYQLEREFGYLEKGILLPAIRLLEDDRAPVLWGITYKFVDDFMGAIGRPVPFMPWDESL